MHLCHLASFGPNFYRSWLDSPRVPPPGAAPRRQGAPRGTDRAPLASFGKNSGQMALVMVPDGIIMVPDGIITVPDGINAL